MEKNILTYTSKNLVEDIKELYKDTTWKWYELKAVALYGLLLGLGLGSYFHNIIENYYLPIGILFVAFGIYIIKISYNKHYNR